MTNQNTALPDSLPEELARSVVCLRNGITATPNDKLDGYAIAVANGFSSGCSFGMTVTNGLLEHIRQQDEKIKMLEMQGK